MLLAVTAAAKAHAKPQSRKEGKGAEGPKCFIRRPAAVAADRDPLSPFAPLRLCVRLNPSPSRSGAGNMLRTKARRLRRIVIVRYAPDPLAESRCPAVHQQAQR